MQTPGPAFPDPLFPHPPRRSRRPRGFSLTELLIALAALAVVTLVTMPSLDRAFAVHRLRAAGHEVSATMHLARSWAARHSAHVAIRFERSDGGVGPADAWTLYVDGDGDGVLTRDVLRGTDPAVPSASGLIRRPLRFAGRVHPGFPPGELPRDPGGRRLQRDRPIRFGRGDLASFGPLGTATPGTVYLTDGRHLAAVRVTGRSGRVRVLVHDEVSGAWR